MKSRGPRGPKEPPPSIDFDSAALAESMRKKAEELGLPPDASWREIRTAFHKSIGMPPPPTIYVDSDDAMEDALDATQEGGAIETIRKASRSPANDNAKPRLR